VTKQRISDRVKRNKQKLVTGGVVEIGGAAVAFLEARAYKIGCKNATWSRVDSTQNQPGEYHQLVPVEERRAS